MDRNTDTPVTQCTLQTPRDNTVHKVGQLHTQPFIQDALKIIHRTSQPATRRESL